MAKITFKTHDNDSHVIDIENGLHWTTYKKYLSRQLSQSILTELDQSTDKILSNIRSINYHILTIFHY